MTKKVGEYEFRWTKSLANPPVDYPEIVKWNTDEGYCFTLLLWRKSKEGWNIEFIGDRPFDHHSDELWTLMRYGQMICDAEYLLEN